MQNAVNQNKGVSGKVSCKIFERKEIEKKIEKQKLPDNIMTKRLSISLKQKSYFVRT